LAKHIPEKDSWMNKKEELGLAKDGKIINVAGINTSSMG